MIFGQTMRVGAVSAALVVAAAFVVLPASAATVTLDFRAEATTVTMPDGEIITVWAFGQDLNPVTLPGPQITVAEGDTLTINLTNDLSEPVSMVIPGQLAAMTPQKFQDNQGRWRARSFTHETAPTATESYTWTNLKAGTYLYHSGSHVAVQVQMGLYGTLIVESSTAGQAYDDPVSAYDAQVVLLYSELDPALHAAVAAGDYGPGLGTTSTIDYHPKYFLVNGEAYSGTTAAVPAGTVGDRVLIRFLNAGLETHTPVVVGARMDVLAEDGNLYRSPPRRHSSLLLPAGQTKDAIIMPSTAGTYPVIDRRLNHSNAGAGPGGMLRFLEVAAP